MRINWRIRINNPIWWAEVLLAIITPIMAYAGITSAEITSWPILGQTLLSAVSNPHIVAMVLVSVFNAVNDPTTIGVGDTKEIMKQTAPIKD